MLDFDKNSLLEWKKNVLKQLLNQPLENTITPASILSDDLTDDIISNVRFLENISLEKLGTSNNKHDKACWGKLYYVASRQFGQGWTPLLDLIISQTPEIVARADNGGVLPENYIPSPIPPKIIQVRPDKPVYTPEDSNKVSWSQKNRSFLYKCFNGTQAQDYIETNLGPRTLEAYNRIGYPAGQADLTALSFLYWEGGVFGDVFSVDRAPISALLNSPNELVLFYSPNRIDKFFIASTPRHPFIKSFLQRAVTLTEYSLTNSSHDKFTDHQALTLHLLDRLCENPNYLIHNKIQLLARKTFDCIVEFNDQDENLGGISKLDSFSTEPAPALIPQETAAGLFLDHNRNTILGAAQATILKPGIPLEIIGHNKHPDWNKRQSRYAITPAAHVYEWNMIGLSGHGCLWNDDKFIQLDSYLSHVGEMESRGGHWGCPAKLGVTQVINEPVIPAFSAGYGCYGHYIVDDLPRLGLIRSVIGESEFRKIKIIFPVKTPEWALNLLNVFFNIEKDQILFFDHERERWLLRKAIVAEYLHRNYVFNPFVREFYRNYVKFDGEPFRKICLSRRTWEINKTHQRIFEQQEWFEEEARHRGFEVIAPEKLSIPEQIKLMCETKIQIGEHGSAQHASIYAAGGTTVGTINPLGDVQINLGRLSGDRNVIVYESESRKDDRNNTFFKCHTNDLNSFFNVL
ncbi:glycosyltransferase 61 family protein [Acetobacter senegalensis]|uniref:glycosyltransferase 61 family protein n=1 Tax=Acetobacter senegalensis TaxID=446692 RepID=UPI0009ED8821|nr:glycosyltransferase 61 family protein [Acetobacter senegalensis]